MLNYNSIQFIITRIAPFAGDPCWCVLLQTVYIKLFKGEKMLSKKVNKALLTFVFAAFFVLVIGGSNAFAAGFETDDNGIKYVNDDGTTLSGWQEIEGKKYYFKEDGYVSTGMTVIGENTYFFDANGVMQTGWQTVGGKKFYFGADGVKETGWISVGSVKYYVDGVEGMFIGQKTIGGKCYYFNEEGIMQTKFVDINGVKYYFGKKGFAQEGFFKYKKKNYFSDKTGKLKTGWFKYKKKYYYFDTKTCEMAAGWAKIDGQKYYFSSKGQAKKGWQNIDGKTYYFTKKGMQVTGFKKIKKKYYYLLKKGDYKTGWMKKGKYKYFFYEDGTMAIGWTNLNGILYYFYKANNKAKKPVGAMAKNTKIDGKKIDKKGRWVGSTPDGMDAKAKNISSNTGYLILVNCDIHYVAIYSGEKGAWKPLFKWQCGNGAPGTETVHGTFSIGSKGYYFDPEGGGRCFYYSQFYGDYLFHSVICDKDGNVIDGRLGCAVSHGCVRLAKENAKWIYDNIPSGTTVVVY